MAARSAGVWHSKLGIQKKGEIKCRKSIFIKQEKLTFALSQCEMRTFVHIVQIKKFVKYLMLNSLKYSYRRLNNYFSRYN